MFEERFYVNEMGNIVDSNNHGKSYVIKFRAGVNGLCNLMNGFYNKTKRLEKENEKLKEELREVKSENMDYYTIINCGNCKYHNYDWYDDGDEFEVCDKGNNERLMYNKFCREWEEL